MDSLKALFLYLEAENISVDKPEFEFQFNSHPDYPSLLALSDTLKFFNINNGAFNIEKSEIDLLPNSFVARLKNGQRDYMSYVEKKKNLFVHTNGTDQKHSTSKHDFENLWDNIVLLAETDVDTVSKSKSYNWSKLFIPLVAVLLLIVIISIDPANTWFLVFYIFPLVGAFLSIAALKDLFNTKNELLNKFCNATSNSSCKTVVNSSKWKIFEVVSFSDLSILFFATQISALFLMGISDNQLDYFYIQTLLLLLSVPVIIASLYYQKYIEKKWCPICLTIMGILLLELGYVLYLNSFLDLSVSLFGALLFLLVASIITAFWFPLKKMLTKVNHLKGVELKANRFKRNYVMFNNMLLSSEHYDLPKSLLVFGNSEAALKISIVTSPFCGHCTEPHYIIESLLEKYGEYVNVSVLHNVNPKNQGLLQFVTTITRLKLDKGDRLYQDAMDFWYQEKDYEKWLFKYRTIEKTKEIENLLSKNQNWYSENDINFTPVLFINGYLYPKEYDIDDLRFFMDELIDDKTLNTEKNINRQRSRKAGRE